MVDHGTKRQQAEAAAVGGGPAPNVTNVPGVLKAFVITSGVMLLIGAILLVILIMLRAAGGGGDLQESAQPGPVDLDLPEGARIEQVIADGKRLVLLAENRDGGQYLAVIDAMSGERLSLIRVNPAP
jgi:hypothetical protein